MELTKASTLKAFLLRRLRLYARSIEEVHKIVTQDPACSFPPKFVSDLERNIQAVARSFISDLNHCSAQPTLAFLALELAKSSEPSHFDPDMRVVDEHIRTAQIFDRTQPPNDLAMTLISQESHLIRLRKENDWLPGDEELGNEIQKYCNIYSDFNKRVATIPGYGGPPMPPLHNLLLLSQSRNFSVWVLNNAKLEDIKSRDLLGRSLLHLAFDLGVAEESLCLFKHPNPISGQDYWGRSPLHMASYTGSTKIATLLIEKNANQVQIDWLERTALHIASERGNVAMVELLLAKTHLEVDFQDENRRSPLSLAVENGHPGVVELLLQKGADVNFEDANGETPLIHALSGGHFVIIGRFLQPFAARWSFHLKDIHYQHLDDCWRLNDCQHLHDFQHLDDLRLLDSSLFDLLQHAVDRDYTTLVKLLLSQNDEDLKSMEVDTETLLSRALLPGWDRSVISLLGQWKARLRSRRGSWLHWNLANLGRWGTPAILQLFLRAGFDINSRMYSDGSLLHYASQFGNVDLVRLLLDEKADIESRGREKQTPLFWAIREQQTDVVAILLNRGADPDARSRNEGTPRTLLRGASIGREFRETVTKMMPPPRSLWNSWASMDAEMMSGILFVDNASFESGRYR